MCVCVCVLAVMHRGLVCATARACADLHIHDGRCVRRCLLGAESGHCDLQRSQAIGIWNRDRRCDIEPRQDEGEGEGEGGGEGGRARDG